MGKKAVKTRALGGEIVLVGCESSGKTLLCNHIEQRLAATAAPEKKKSKKNVVGIAPEALSSKTQPTIGVILMECVHRECSFSVREAGGAMQPVWAQYLSKANAVIFMVDTSSAEAMSSAVVELYDLVRQCPETATLVFLNKRDAPSALPEECVRMMLQLEELERIYGEWLKVVSGSALTGEGIEALLDWSIDSLVAREELEAIVNERLAKQKERHKKQDEDNAKLSAEINAAAQAAYEGKEVTPPLVPLVPGPATAEPSAAPPPKKGFFGRRSK